MNSQEIWDILAPIDPEPTPVQSNIDLLQTILQAVQNKSSVTVDMTPFVQIAQQVQKMADRLDTLEKQVSANQDEIKGTLGRTNNLLNCLAIRREQKNNDNRERRERMKTTLYSSSRKRFRQTVLSG